MAESGMEEEVNYLDFPPALVPAFSLALHASVSGAPLRRVAEQVLFGDVADRQQLDLVSFQRQLEGATASTSLEAEGEGRATLTPAIKPPFLRRLIWARFLRLLEGEDVEQWAHQVQDQRREYHALREKQQLSAKRLASLDPQRFHPLAPTAGNPWQQKQQDEELQEEIWRDIERTYPERALFSRIETRRSLQRVLFAWAKKNSDISYRQGMNELLAVIYSVCSREGLPPLEQQVINSSPLTAASSALFSSDPQDVEADSFRLFDALMTSCCMRAMYLPPQQQPAAAAAAGAGAGAGESPLLPSRLGGASAGVGVASAVGPPPTSSRIGGPPSVMQSAVLLRCNRVFNSLLAKADPAVYRHLESVGVEPQIFLLRWLRLLFCREFHVEDTLLIWDALFADAWLEQSNNNQSLSSSSAAAAAAAATTGAAGGERTDAAEALPPPPAAAGAAGAAGAPSAEALAMAASSRLPLVDYFAVAMLEFIRQHLLQSDSSGVLKRLFKFPPIESVQCLVALALATRDAGTIPAPLASAACSSSSTSSNNSSGSNRGIFAAGRSPYSNPHHKIVQGRPPPLTPSVIVGMPQLQEPTTIRSTSNYRHHTQQQQQHPLLLQQQQQQEEEEGERERDEPRASPGRRKMEPASAATAAAPATAAEGHKPGGQTSPFSAGSLGGHIEAMRQALASVAGECNEGQHVLLLLMREWDGAHGAYSCAVAATTITAPAAAADTAAAAAAAAAADTAGCLFVGNVLTNVCEDLNVIKLILNGSVEYNEALFSLPPLSDDNQDIPIQQPQQQHQQRQQQQCLRPDGLMMPLAAPTTFVAPIASFTPDGLNAAQLFNHALPPPPAAAAAAPAAAAAGGGKGGEGVASLWGGEDEVGRHRKKSSEPVVFLL
ncbi:hypothetical protein ACSSS7_001245 [Eimeria intestinalis]